MASGVQMQRYWPPKTPPPTQVQSRRNNNRLHAKPKDEIPQDPLQVLGYRNSSVALEVIGSFGGLQILLQLIEALECWVESRDLALKAVVQKEDADSLQSVEASTQFTLRLSVYDFSPIADVPSNASMSSPT